MDLEEIKEIYRQEAAQARQKLARTQQEIIRISTARVALFAAGAAGAIYYGTSQWTLTAGIIAATLTPFLLLMKLHNRKFWQKAYQEQEVAVNEQELAAIDYRYGSFEAGEEFAAPTHLYSYDLDLFGQQSLFQYINRTCTQPGRTRLAAWLGNHLLRKQDIEERQAAIQELAPCRDFRQRFRILGLLHKGQAADEHELRQWAESGSYFSRRRWMRALPPVVGSINVLCLGLTVAGIIPAGAWGSMWICLATLSFTFTGRITKVQSLYGKKLHILSTYARLLHLIEGQPMQAPLLSALKQRISAGNEQASQAIGKLNRLMNALDQRNNFFVLSVLNGLFFWELWQMMRIEAWKLRYADQLPEWMEALGQTDALCSMATFAYNHPDYVYATLEEEGSGFRLSAQQMGHPLMHRDRCVRNDFDMRRRPAFIIITGANMAGKSTYLRTVGVNYVLACCGMPACAQNLTVTPAQLVTSLRTTDSLTDNESYFFAELKRLKLIIDLLKEGKQLFIILDEILKGTNSTDKQKGSLALVRQLLALGANGIIATHDLLLGTLAHEFPHEIDNFCFEADIADNELTFAYRMRPGVAQNMNACFLMKKMGIVLTD